MSRYYSYEHLVDFSSFVGKVFKSITKSEDEERLTFVTNTDEVYEMFHYQDCCEHVYIEDIVGDLNDLLDTPIFLAEEVTDHGMQGEYGDSYTWTYYKLRTVKGSVDIRWYGTSNGYYSETAAVYRVDDQDEDEE